MNIAAQPENRVSAIFQKILDDCLFVVFKVRQRIVGQDDQGHTLDTPQGLFKIISANQQVMPVTVSPACDGGIQV